MKLGYAILYVASVADTLAFYERAFGLERGMVAETGEYGELRTGGTTLAFAANSFARGLTDVPFEVAALDKAAPPIELGFVTDEVETNLTAPSWPEPSSSSGQSGSRGANLSATSGTTMASSSKSALPWRADP